MSTCTFLGIFPDYIEDAGDSVDNLMDKFGFTLRQKGAVWRVIEKKFCDVQNCFNLTNKIIYCIFEGGIEAMCFVKQDLNEEDFDYYVNGMDSHLYYQGEEY